ncbi:hypothetical protein HRI_004813400 [Hibiscus trionum]|uniref:Phytocyanin domain-containing protein n=1 Tax=Hibiscus trionum TaxID=183268 RepID=A0A9W7MSR8_HIBTR|nr:hypothetical protein HRI_004813400 [Hibiscus trionum]
MKFQRFLSLFLVSLACFVSSSYCSTFYVGGKEGWVLQPKEKYNDWAGKQRFQINDILIFKYEKGSDSVLMVKKDDYYKCEGKQPLMEMSNGTSEFKFPHSGPFFFISGKEGHCSQGQKMITVVMAERHGAPSSHPPTAKPPGKSPYPGPIAYPPTAQSPGSHGPVAKPPTGSTPGPAHGPISSPPSSVPAGSPMAHGPVHSPAPTQSPSSVPTGSPMAHGPTHSPAPSTNHAPQYGPSQSPVAYGPTANPPTSTSPSPSSSSPQASTPTALSPAPPTGSGSSPPAPPQGISPSSTTTTPSPSGSQTSTPTSRSSATATYTSVLVLAAGLLFSMIFW